MNLSRILILLIITSTTNLRAANIVVTNNFDNGTGSLRWAIETANTNGFVTPDIIQFNIPLATFNDHIILLDSELPALTSNITIDGSSQPGQFFGLTNAKVAIKHDQYVSSLSILRINEAKNVNIYGLYLYIGYWEGIFNNPSRSNLLYGITISNSFDIEIGAPGKGNVINGAQYAIYSSSDSCRNIRIRSNFIGQGGYFYVGNDPAVGTDVDDIVLSCEYAVFLKNVKDINIGGANVADGNIFASRESITITSDYETKNGFVNIQHNMFNKWYDKVMDMEYHPFMNYNITIGGEFYSNIWCDYEVNFSDNWVNATVQLGQLTKYFTIQRNNFITPPGSRYDRTKLTIYHCNAGGLIGGDNSSDANYFTDKYEFGQFALYATTNGPVTVLKNIFHCNYSYASVTNISHDNSSLIPVAQVDNTTSSSVSGRATPGSKVDLYYDDECDACEGEIYIASVYADAAGNWQYHGAITGPVVVMPTSAAGYTGNFSFPIFNETNRVIVQPTCGKSNGRITGITSEGAESYFWLNLQTGDTVGRTHDLYNVPAGEYALYGRHGTSCIGSIGQSILLEDYSPNIYTNNSYTVDPTCGKFNGVISGVYFTKSNFLVKWIDEQGNILGDDNTLGGLAAGKYALIVLDTTVTGGCSDTATFTLTNLSGPSLITANMQINAATCSNADGSITGITSGNANGIEYVEWTNGKGEVIGNAFNLLNVPGGNYQLKYKDESSCDTIITPYYTVPSPQMNEISVVKVNTEDGYCMMNNGSIAIDEFSTDVSAYNLQWIENNSGRVEGYGASISGLAEGSYSLWLKDQNGCKAKIYSHEIVVHPDPSIDISRAVIIDDQCSMQHGSISNIKITGTHGIVSYTWENISGDNIGTNANLNNIGSGSYRLTIKDEKSCTASTSYIMVGNDDNRLPVPVFDNVIIAKNTPAMLKVRNYAAGDYIFYSDALGQNIITHNNTGVLETPPLSSETTYYVRFVSGTCSSDLAKVTVRISDKSFFTIPSAFTPNNDGRNDYIEVKVAGYVQLEYFKIFNRYGQEIFNSKKLNDKWDGKIKGIDASAGTYVWMAKGSDIYGAPVTGKGTITLIK